MRFTAPSLAVLPFLTSTCFAQLYEKASDLRSLTFDYVIVGGGLAGSVVASRLSEDPSVSVLLLEAGVTIANVTSVAVPLLCPTLYPNTAYDWNYTTVPQTNLDGQAQPYTRGFALGGGTSVNSMFYTRGSVDDYDAYARITGDPGWSWDQLWPYMLKNEKLVPPNDGHNTSGQLNPNVHSTTGVLDVSVVGYGLPTDSRVIGTSEDFPADFPYREDMNGGDPIGVAWLQASIGAGKRSSSASAYLSPRVLARPNLSVLLHARVTKIVQTGSSHGLPVFSGVDFAASASGPVTRVNATKEVILSAGAINTPQLLLLSGIGNKTELSASGIPTLVDLPSVGKNMSDQTVTPNAWYSSTNDTMNDRLNPSVLNNEVSYWNKTGKGPLSWTFVNQLAWLRLSDDDAIFSSYSDPTPGPRSAHFELMVINGYIGAGSPTGNFVTITSNVASPISRGTVKLNSSNPWDAPLIDPNYFGHPFDVHVAIAAVKAAKKFVSGKAWAGFIGAPYGDLANANTDAEIETYLRTNTLAALHALGTASISPKGASWGVVDPDLKVKGTVGLRIVDASIIPVAMSGHPEAGIYFFAERGADLVKSS